jgi:osmoprotectant transport system ATP-binding protein
MSAIVVEGLSKQFPGEPRAAVDQVSLSVEPGSLVVLIGPSGCGKTTLLKLINRLYEPSSGRVLIDGTDAATVAATTLRRRMGYVIQQTGLFPHMRIENNIATVPELLGWERERINQRIDELLTLVGLPLEYRRRYPRQLSGGQQQRVGIARALAADPAIMLMDEPFGALDALNRVRLQDELLSIQQRLHKTILFVTHDIEEALRLADKVVVMREGRVVQHDTPLNLVAAPADKFVAELVGADDVLRRLSLVEAGSLPGQRSLTMPPDPDWPSISAGQSLREALAALMLSEAPAVRVESPDGLGPTWLTFDDIRGAVTAPAA